MATKPGASLLSIELVYRAQFARFLHVATAITGDAERGADAVQEAFAKAVRRRLDFRREGSLEGWLWRTVVNCARDQVRRPQRSSSTPEPVVPTEPDHDRLRSWIAQLPERQRLVLFLRYYADLDYRQIAHALGIRTGTVAAALNAAHAALRPLLESTEVPHHA